LSTGIPSKVVGTGAVMENSFAIPLRIATRFSFVMPLLKRPKTVNGSISVTAVLLSTLEISTQCFCKPPAVLQ
jgi:hypothetical protein